MSRSVSSEGLALLKAFEGFGAQPAQLPDGAWVVGYGHVRIGEAGADVSEAEAEQLLGLDLAPIERCVAEAVTAELSQGQFDALCSFAFSIGSDAFLTSAVLRRVNKGDFIAAACAMDAWRKSDVRGEMQIIDALVRRRAAEKAMFLAATAAAGAPSAFVRAKLDHAASVLGAPADYQAAPEAGSIPPAPPKPDPAERLTEILASEPATATLLLTRVATEEEIAEAEAEIITAHAKPVARVSARTAPGPRIVRLIPVERIAEAARKGAKRMPRFSLPKFSLPTVSLPKVSMPKIGFKIARPLEAGALVALMGFGAGLVALAAASIAGGRAEWNDYVGALLLGAPGVTALVIGGYSFVKGPSHAGAREAA